MEHDKEKQVFERPELKSYTAIDPKIYAYQTPGVVKHEGWTKIGEARRQSVEARIKQQTQTVGVDWELRWVRPARYADGADFRDKDFHAYLERQGVEREWDEETRRKREWFRIGGEESLERFETFVRRGAPPKGKEMASYFLRNEQAEAVLRAREWFEGGGEAFLWNAKPRFGKTLTAYDLVRQMHCKKVMVVTNRPAVSSGWVEDFFKFIAWQEPSLLFLSENEEAKKGRPGVLSRKAYLAKLDAQDPKEEPYGFVVFESMQGLKGSRYFGGKFEKLKWLTEIDFDLLIIDEAHEGVETERADFAIEQLSHRHRLHLSGTPFKQLASGAFTPENTFTWSYVDEQEMKEAWAGEENNPYEDKPTLRMFTYQLSPMVETEVRRGFDTDHKYAFDLMEFFATDKNGGFVYKEEVRNFLRTLTTNEKYPFGTPALREQLRHTIWVLNRVASVKALKKMMEEAGSVFKDYAIILAAGDGKSLDDENEVIPMSTLDRVKKAIKDDTKPTITLSVGQLTVGVTVPEWTGILMLNECKSPAAYFQATFRVQNPDTKLRDGKLYMKEEAYVFDFNPTRTLTLFEQLASETVPVEATAGETPEQRRERKIRKLLNFFPVIGEDEQGRMVSLDVGQVLSIPRRLKCQEVVRRGFMSNFLFHNVANLFQNPGAYEDILNRMPEADDFHGTKKNPEEVMLGGVQVDGNGNVQVPENTVIGTATDLFGDKVYGVEGAGDRKGPQPLPPPPPPPGVSEPTGLTESTKAYVKEVMGQVRESIVGPVADKLGLKPADRKAVERQVERGMKQAVAAADRAYRAQKKEAERAFEQAKADAPDEAALAALEVDHQATLAELDKQRQEAVETAAAAYEQGLYLEVPRMALTAQAEAEKQSVEKQVRDRLRGFSRTIPSFLMAYGDDKLELANFDQYVEPEVFKEVTGITLEEFRLLRDGGTLNGQEVEGHLFEETVFNDSVKAFLEKKRKLANYLSEEAEEDIFDYIPPQKTNQIFTPREVVVRMVDTLERENPGCFDNPDYTFADLYVKSGLYLAEIAKRLFRSAAMKARFPEDRVRLEHIFTQQLYAMAPTAIIHRIVLAYLLDFDPNLRKRAAPHFALADAAAAAQADRLPALVQEVFG